MMTETCKRASKLLAGIHGVWIDGTYIPRIQCRSNEVKAAQVLEHLTAAAIAQKIAKVQQTIIEATAAGQSRMAIDGYKRHLGDLRRLQGRV